MGPSNFIIIRTYRVRKIRVNENTLSTGKVWALWTWRFVTPVRRGQYVNRLDKKFFRNSCGLTGTLKKFRAFPKSPLNICPLVNNREFSSKAHFWSGMLSESSLEYEACRVMSQMLSGNICDIATVILLADQKSCSGFTQEFHVPHTGEFDRKFWSKSPRNLF